MDYNGHENVFLSTQFDYVKLRYLCFQILVESCVTHFINIIKAHLIHYNGDYMEIGINITRNIRILNEKLLFFIIWSQHNNITLSLYSILWYKMIRL